MKRPRAVDRKSTVNEAGPPLSPLSTTPHSANSGQRNLLVILIGLYLCVAITHALHAPIGATGYQDAPDEAAHVTVAKVIATGRMPTREQPGTVATDTQPAYEWHQPPLYYLLAACLLPFGDKGIRLLSVLIGIACIVVIYQAGRVLFPERPEVATLAAGIAALIPGHCAITSVVNNDGLLELCFSGYFLILFTAFMHGLTTGRSVILGGLLGAALLTKLTAVLLLPISVVGLVLLWRNGETKTSIVRSALVIMGLALAISGWWFIRNSILYHEWLPLTAFAQAFKDTAKATDVVSGRLRVAVDVSSLPVDNWSSYAWLVTRWTFQSFFAVYSTPGGAPWGVPAYLPVSLYLLAAFLTCLIAIGQVLVIGRGSALIPGGGRGFTREQKDCLAIMYFGLALVLASFVLFTSRYFQAQGRYFYPLMLPIALVSALGWRAIFHQRYQTMASMLLLLVLGAFCAAFLRFTA